LGKKIKRKKEKSTLIEGIVDHVNKRYCFIKSEKFKEDTKILTKNMRGAIHGDKVLFSTINNYTFKNFEGKIIKIVERSRNTFIGKIQDSGDFAFFIPDHKNIFTDFFIKKSKNQKITEDYKVLVKVNKWHTRGKPEAIIIKTLGKSGHNETEINSIMYEYNLPQSFSKNVISETNNLKNNIDEQEISKRKDIREIQTFTIDPRDAKDFDDALSIKETKNGFYNVGIHIADVAHFFSEKTEINREAEKRATSVYLVDRTIPMLPEKLSNYLCSLRPNTDRLTFSIMCDINLNAEIKNIWIGKTIIHSEKRFTYEEAQKIIENENGKFSNGLKILNSIAKKIRKKRFESGAFNFRTKEIEFKLNENKKPINIYLKKRRDSHKMIEEFMLLANKIVAEKISEIETRDKNKYTFVYRIHEDPSLEKLIELKNYISQFGYTINTEEKNLSDSLNQLMQKIKGKPEENSIEKFTVRSMSKAIYSTRKEKHFGLAFKNYTHFTSPIRRFPDIMVHRLLNRYLLGEKTIDKKYFDILCKHSSAMELNATSAERESIKFKQVEYMSQFINKNFEGIISGITEWGIFIEIIKTQCEGLVKVSSLKDDYYEFDKKNMKIVGKNSKKKYQLGQSLVVKVIDTDVDRRTIDLELL